MFTLLRKSTLIQKAGSATGIIHSPDRYRRSYARRSTFNDPSASRPTQHYDVLGLSPKATHGEIKTAYYKLSMTYHPDRNQGSESAALKFRQLNEAYEVLGNMATRRRYDQGLSVNVGTGPASSPTHDEVNGDLDRKRWFKHSAPVPSGRSTIYDYDNWVKNHYGELFNRRQDTKTRFDEKEVKARSVLHLRLVWKTISVCMLSGLSFVVAIFLFEEFGL